MATKLGPEPSTLHALPDYESQPLETPPPSSALWRAVVAVLTPLASLKLTVALFLMAIFIVFAGTLAQTEKDIWLVMDDYFRMDLTSFRSALDSALAWIDFRIFFPRSFFPQMTPIPWGHGFYFPSGWLIGMVMFANLMAAHLIRFRVRGRGRPLLLGTLIVACGIALGWVVIAAGSRQTATQWQLFTDWPSLRILWLLVQCTAVSVVLLIGCALIFQRRAGIVVLHAGVGLMMVGELVVGVAAVEGQMSILENQTVNYVLDTRELELALIDTSDAKEDDVVVIPQARLIPSQVIQDPQLPCDVEMVDFQLNSVRRPVSAGAPNPATAGRGLQEMAVAAAPISGTDTSSQSNRSAAYVRLLAKGTAQDLGVYLVGLEDWMSGGTESVSIDGKTYQMSLRYKHTYKPYSMHLIDVEQDVYMGTQTPRAYSSTLRLVDPTRNVDRTVKIWMNNPLRFAGETFYQTNYGRDANTGVEHTGLQVVSNLGWRIPYVSCMMLAVGMFGQFGLTLASFLRRVRGASTGGSLSRLDDPSAASRDPRQAPALSVDSSPRSSTRSWADSLVPLGVVVLCALWLLSKSYMPGPQVGQVDLNAFGRLPVMFEGRIKPIDTLARNSLRIISDREIVKDAQGATLPAIGWLLDVITDSPTAANHRVFRIQNLEVLETLGLERRKGFRYALNEFLPKLDAFSEQARRARMMEPLERGAYERKILDLQRRLNHYILLIESFRPAPLRMDSLSHDLSQEASRREQNNSSTLPLAVPPRDPDDPWQPYSFAEFDERARSLAAAQGIDAGEPNPATAAWTRILTAYGDKSSDAAAFNRSVQDLHNLLAENPPQAWQPRRINIEANYNHFSPYYYAIVLYFGAVALGCLSWLVWHVPLRRAATWLALFTFCVHTLALVARMYISGRPPVTSLYTSALFVGWAGVALAILLEMFSRLGVANVVGAFLGAASLLYATVVVPPTTGDSFAVLVAVLDTQFWLATHVICVTIGYAATFVAGLLGVVFVIKGFFFPAGDGNASRAIARMLYGTVCFAMFFSFFGTVLGGLWADDSWGRFWGWDPKENGALIIVLWNAVLLHAYWGRMVDARGMAVLAIFGNIVTLWSWSGVNELNVGLHTYGFTEGTQLLLAIIVAVNLGLIALGLVPQRFWQGHVSVR